MFSSLPTPPLKAALQAPTLDNLAQRHAALVEAGRTGFTLRKHRALSWLRRAEAAGVDDNVAFICLWIAFNAAYAQDAPGYSEKAASRLSCSGCAIWISRGCCMGWCGAIFRGLSVLC